MAKKIHLWQELRAMTAKNTMLNSYNNNNDQSLVILACFRRELLNTFF